jgi:hypothetical protein
VPAELLTAEAEPLPRRLPCLQGGLWSKLSERLPGGADAEVEHGRVKLSLPEGGRISITKVRQGRATDSSKWVGRALVTTTPASSPATSLLGCGAVQSCGTVRAVQDPGDKALVVHTNLHDFYGSDGTDSEVPFRRAPSILRCLLRVAPGCRWAVREAQRGPAALAGTPACWSVAAAACMTAPFCRTGTMLSCSPAFTCRLRPGQGTWEAGGEELHTFLEDGLAKHLKIQVSRVLRLIHRFLPALERHASGSVHPASEARGECRRVRSRCSVVRGLRERRCPDCRWIWSRRRRPCTAQTPHKDDGWLTLQRRSLRVLCVRETLGFPAGGALLSWRHQLDSSVPDAEEPACYCDKESC